MNREELKEILGRIIDKMEEAPQPACIYGDDACDAMTTLYAVGEEG